MYYAYGVILPVCRSQDMSNATDKPTDPGSMILVVGLSVGVPLSLLALTGVVVAVVWFRGRSSGRFESMEPRTNTPKTVQDYPPVSYPTDSAHTEAIYENYQPGAFSPHAGSQAPVTASGGQRSVLGSRLGVFSTIQHLTLYSSFITAVILAQTQDAASL